MKVSLEENSFSDDEFDEEEEGNQSTSKLPLRKIGMRQVTMKYNMQTLRLLQGIDDRAKEMLAPIYNCDPEEIPVDFDILEVYQAKPEDRRQLLSEIFEDPQYNFTSFFDFMIEELSKLA